MEQQKIALCDSNFHYGSRLADYLERHTGFPYTVLYFSDITQLRAYAEEKKFQYLILGEDLIPEYTDDRIICAEVLFLLTKQELQQKETQTVETAETKKGTAVSIYRYQPAGNIMRQILGYLCQIHTDKSEALAQSEAAVKLIGIYSPVKRCMQTGFSLLLGQMLAKKRRTLYVNTEAYSGFRFLLGRDLKPDITDLMYYAERERPCFLEKLEGMIDTIGGLEYIPPAAAYTDLRVIEAGQWLKFIHELREDGRFGYLILDLTEHVDGLFRILEQCDIIYTIEGGDAVSTAKLREYEQMLNVAECRQILDKTRIKSLPKIHPTGISFDQLIYSELADYVRVLVQEDFSAS